MESSGIHFTQVEGLVKGILEEDTVAWEILIREGKKDIKRAMYKSNIPLLELDDVCQLVFVSFYKALNKRKDAIENLVHFAAKVWFKRVKFEVLNYKDAMIKKEKNEIKKMAKSDNDELLDTFDIIKDEKESQKNNDVILDVVVAEFLINYSEAYQQLFTDYIYRGKSFAEISRATGIKVETIKSRFKKMSLDFQKTYPEMASM